MPSSEGTLPVIYLGVPLISLRLFNKDCKFLVENAKNRIAIGRTNLCPMPGDYNYLIRCFLWCNGELKQGKAKVAWHDICFPNKEGRLGICSLEMFNIALMTTHIWNLVSNKDSIWVRWINIYKLKGRSFWDVLVTSRWCVQCPLLRFLLARGITREGFSMLASVKDMISNEGWLWPQSWLLKALILGQLVVPSLDPNKPDLHYWRDSNGVMRNFSVKAVWEEIRPRGL
nr:hypothetical protein [Tanacetum cinerariifolium]